MSGKKLKAAALCLQVFVFLPGCTSWPYLDSMQEAYRVDPVVVQWDKRVMSGGNCRRAPDDESLDGSTSASTPKKSVTDVLCPVDLDTWKFPHDQETDRRATAEAVAQRRGKAAVAAAETRMPAYARLSACYEDNVGATRTSTTQSTLATLKAQLTQLLEEIKALEAQRTRLEGAINTLTTSISPLEKLATPTDAQKAALKKLQDDRDAARNALPPVQTRLKALDSTTRKKLEFDIAQYESAVAAAAAAGDGAATSAAVASASQGAVRCAAMRNLFQDEILTRSEAMCRKHLSDVAATSATVNTTLGFGTLLSATLGAVVTGEAAVRYLSGGASLLSGSQNLVSREVYREFVVPAIARAIDDERRKRLIEIRVEQGKPLNEYTVARALRDAVDYHESCSFSHGLILLTTSPEKRVLPNEDALQKQIIDLESQLVRLADVAKTVASPEETDAIIRTRVRLREQIEDLHRRIDIVRRTR